MIVIQTDMRQLWISILIVVLAVMSSQAQTSTTTASDTSKVERAFIQNANSQRVDVTTDTTVQYLIGDVRFYYDSTYFFCDSAVVSDYKMLAVGNVSIMKTDSLRIFCDSLIYYPDSAMAYFYGEKDGSVVLQNGESELFTNYMIYDVDRELAMYTNRGLLITPTSKVKSGRGFFHVKSKYANFYDDVSVVGDDFDILTDSLRYYDLTSRAEFLAPVVVNQGPRRIFSESGYFDIDDDEGQFIGNAQVIEDGNTSTADKIVYDGEQELTSLLGNAKYRSEAESGEADSIYYDKKADTVKLLGQASFRDATNEVTGDEIHYDKKTEAMDVAGRSFLSNPPYLVVADDLNYQKESGQATADGTVIWQDTSSDYTIYADHLRYTEVGSNMKAYNDVGKPLLESVLGVGDTMFLSGDTLFSFEQVYYHVAASPDSQLVSADSLAAAASTDSLQAEYTADSLAVVRPDTIMMSTDSLDLVGDAVIDSLQAEYTVDSLAVETPDTIQKPTDSLDLVGDAAIDSLAATTTVDTVVQHGKVDTQRIFVSYRNVEILMADIQAVCDSFTYLEKQKKFVLADGPIMWSDSSQFSGDTITIYQGEKDIEKVHLQNNAVLLSTEDMQFFNQLSGNTADIYFDNKKVRQLDVDEGATSVYYLLDEDKAYIGANETTCRRIVFTFVDGEAEHTRFYDKNDHTLTPMEQVNHEAIKVQGYNWNIERKPTLLSDLKD